MKLALIPPYALMAAIKRTDYQMVLPQNLSNLQYKTGYQKARANGNFLMLDNGAAEGLTYTPQALQSLATEIMANEIVVPDKMNDAAATIQLMKDYQPFKTQAFNYIGVLQGTTWSDLAWMVDTYYGKPWIDTIGIPRHLLTSLTSGFDSTIRVKLAQYITTQYPGRFNIHLLGTSPDFIQETWDNRRDFELYKVRGVDTSAPFNYAYAGKPVGQQIKVVRPADYFNLVDTTFDGEYLSLNLHRLKKWTDWSND